MRLDVHHRSKSACKSEVCNYSVDNAMTRIADRRLHIRHCIRPAECSVLSLFSFLSFESFVSCDLRLMQVLRLDLAGLQAGLQVQRTCERMARRETTEYAHRLLLMPTEYTSLTKRLLRTVTVHHPASDLSCLLVFLSCPRPVPIVKSHRAWPDRFFYGKRLNQRDVVEHTVRRILDQFALHCTLTQPNRKKASLSQTGSTCIVNPSRHRLGTV